MSNIGGFTDLKMAQLTLQQRKFIVEELLLTTSLKATRRKFKKKYGFAPCKTTQQKTMSKWQQEATLPNLNGGALEDRALQDLR